MLQTVVLNTEDNSKRNVLGGLLRWTWKFAVALLIVLLLAVINNNYSLLHMSRVEFDTRLDRSIEASTNWMAGHNEILGTPP